MSVLGEEGQACAQEEGDVRGGDLDNAGVIVNVKREVKGLAITRPVSQVYFGEVSRQVNKIVMDDRQGQRSARFRTT